MAASPFNSSIFYSDTAEWGATDPFQAVAIVCVFFFFFLRMS